MKNSNVFIPFNPILSKESMKSYIDTKVSEELLNESIERLMKVAFAPPTDEEIEKGWQTVQKQLNK